MHVCASMYLCAKICKTQVNIMFGISDACSGDIELSVYVYIKIFDTNETCTHTFTCL